MSRARFYRHPVLLNKKSRLIFVCFTIASALVCTALWKDFFSIVSSAGIHLSDYPSRLHLLLSICLSPLTHAALFVAGILLGGGITATHIVSPIKRIEDWLSDAEQGLEIKPLDVRSEDSIYQNIIRMMNEFYEKNSAKRRNKN